MPWELYVHTIDVGQGESSLIVARDPAVNHRTMLIDGGLIGYTQTVHDYVVGRLAPLGYGLDHILMSHYDDDHSGGILGLLIADNVWAVCRLISDQVAACAVLGLNRAARIACGALAVAACVSGAYDDPNGVQNASAQIIPMCNALLPHVLPGTPDVAAVIQGMLYAANNLQLPLNPAFPLAAARRRNLARSAATAAAVSIAAGGGNLAADIFALVFLRLSSLVPAYLRVNTGGLYRNTHLIDIGAAVGIPPPAYLNAVRGAFTTVGGYLFQVPGVDRQRTTPALGAEILWNSGTVPIPAPANSPALFTAAVNALVWQGPNAPAPVNGGQAGNDVSIGLIARFNHFFYYSGGDLPSVGEDPLAQAVLAYGFANPQGGGLFPAAVRIAAFKCGHHGSAHSTSQNFLNTTNACAAFLSCGRNQFGPENHPSQATINRLHGQAAIQQFYLTNCSYVTNWVPASNGLNQLVVGGNKSRVAGQNNVLNLAPGRNRGSIVLALDQAESLGAGVPQQFHVGYYDDDVVLGLPVGPRIDTTPF